MNDSKANEAAAEPPLDCRVRCLAEAEKYLRDEADFNRSWVDGRRGADLPRTEEYTARRLEIAQQRDNWANAIAFAITKLASN